MPHRWSLQEARNRLSEVIDDAASHGPQVITHCGVHTAVVLAYDDFRRLTLSRSKLSEFFAKSPLAGIDLDLTRDASV